MGFIMFFFILSFIVLQIHSFPPYDSILFHTTEIFLIKLEGTRPLSIPNFRCGNINKDFITSLYLNDRLFDACLSPSPSPQITADSCLASSVSHRLCSFLIFLFSAFSLVKVPSKSICSPVTLWNAENRLIFSTVLAEMEHAISFVSTVCCIGTMSISEEDFCLFAGNGKLLWASDPSCTFSCSCK